MISEKNARLNSANSAGVEISLFTAFPGDGKTADKPIQIRGVISEMSKEERGSTVK